MAFVKGQSNGAHHPKGSRNRIQADVIEMFAEHWEKHGREAIDIVFKERPSDYLRFAANFLPKEQIVQEARPEAEMTDDEFRGALEKVQALKAVE